MKILAIETSCDETAISILDCEQNTVRILAHEINSQIELHKEYGGVFPTVAKREHARNCVPVLDTAFSKVHLLSENFSLTEDAEIKIKNILEREQGLFELLIPFLKRNGKPQIDTIAVTEGPGLEPALWVGIMFAKALSLAWNIPVVPVNHMEGHIVSAMLKHTDSNIAEIEILEFPAIALLVSGGHTELVKVKEIGSYETVGRTRDDAVGEAFDKVARLLGFPYPGGPEISKLAQEAREDSGLTTQNPEIKLPRPMLHSGDLDFSFSGIKTAVRYMIEKIPELTPDLKKVIAREFEDSVVEVLVAKTKKALGLHDARTLIVGGGVIANKKLRTSLVQELSDTKIFIPDMKLTTDNATMIGIAGYLKINRSTKAFSNDINAQGSQTLDKHHNNAKV